MQSVPVAVGVHSRKRLTLAITLALCGCATTQGYAPKPVAMPAGVSYEVVSVEDQARAEIEATPTEFFVDFGDDSFAWSRAKEFLHRYAGGDGHFAAGPLLLSSRGSRQQQGSFIYEIERVPGRGGFTYVVRCFPADGMSTGPSAILNARNAARFIRDGSLEVALLAK